MNRYEVFIMRLIRLKEVIELTGLSRSCIYKYIEEGRFPRNVPLGGRSVGWVESEIHDWIQSAIASRDSSITQ
ncbi:helix-turn-helix transcriptional regulator [Vibrio sp. M260118]|uniref:helix-turn-helix transcriptional regulator n=1 Tax=Vibrio sp. M260118 TaxID=3020896 RepID=UPI002F3ED6DD